MFIYVFNTKGKIVSEKKFEASKNIKGWRYWAIPFPKLDKLNQFLQFTAT